MILVTFIRHQYSSETPTRLKLVHRSARRHSLFVEPCQGSMTGEVRWHPIALSELIPYLPLMSASPLSRRVARVSSFFHQLWAIAIFRSWRILSFYGAWATGVCFIHHCVWNVSLQPTLLTVYVIFTSVCAWPSYNCALSQAWYCLGLRHFLWHDHQF